MIEARGLVKPYCSTMAVNDLSFSIRSGQVTSFLGPNGAGKPNVGFRHFFPSTPLASQGACPVWARLSRTVTVARVGWAGPAWCRAAMCRPP